MHIRFWSNVETAKNLWYPKLSIGKVYKLLQLITLMLAVIFNSTRIIAVIPACAVLKCEAQLSFVYACIPICSHGVFSNLFY